MFTCNVILKTLYDIQLYHFDATKKHSITSILTLYVITRCMILIYAFTIFFINYHHFSVKNSSL